MTADHADVDAFVGDLVPSRIAAPDVIHRDVVCVTGPWLAGTSSVAAALAAALPDVTVVERDDLAPGEAPAVVVFAASAVAPLTPSDCALAETATADTDAVIGAVTRIDVHHRWRDVLAEDRDLLAAHADRYAAVPWVGVAAAPQLGPPQLDDLVAAVRAALGDPGLARRNRLRAWHTKLDRLVRRSDADAAGTGSQLAALRERRSALIRQRRLDSSERATALRGELAQARVQLGYFARKRCASVRGELQEDVASLRRAGFGDFRRYVRARVEEVATDVDAGITERLGAVAATLGLPAPAAAPPAPPPAVPAPGLRSRRLEGRLMMLLGAAFGMGVALTLGRLVADLAPAYAVAGIAAGVLVGSAVAVWVVRSRGLLHDRALLDRWVGDVLAEVRAHGEQRVASCVLAAETAMAAELAARDAAESAGVAADVERIDDELRRLALAEARAAARRDRELPALRRAREKVAAALSETAPADPESVTRR
ncbi:TIGR04086 family membrane protein [Mycobacterium sp. MYCO198283]|uniref:TIGR04086 family membrane protein n=1 Tax=Mycobacterium sp. MYCO198283 TaxID=2883505 RepID=UPI001E5139C7|nr:TIGR04086 family membrane protein [Mycobacterium sp. MYCO198283]MCG5432004.1 TIGR04086 family membrane protein [Mycobacterium sp. MYCO198283]